MQLKTLLNKMLEIQSLYNPLLMYEGGGYNRDIFDRIKEISAQFEDTSGFTKNLPEFRQAARIHKKILQEILTEYPQLRDEIPTRYLFYT